MTDSIAPSSRSRALPSARTREHQFKQVWTED